MPSSSSATPSQVLANTSTLEVVVAEEEATYTCRVTVKNYPELVGSAKVFRCPSSLSSLPSPSSNSS